MGRFGAVGPAIGASGAWGGACGMLARGCKVDVGAALDDADEPPTWPGAMDWVSGEAACDPPMVDGQGNDFGPKVPPMLISSCKDCAEHEHQSKRQPGNQRARKPEGREVDAHQR
jgi:hypothetical protein